MKHIFEVRSSTWTHISKETAQLLNNELSFTEKVYVGKDSRSWIAAKKFELETTRMIEILDIDDFRFPTGLLDRACNCILDYGQEYEIIDNVGFLEYQTPNVEGIDFRYYQNDLVSKFLEYQRGVIHGATGSGKTFVTLGICSAFPQNTILILIHSKDLVFELVSELIKYGFKGVGEWSGRQHKLGRITVATLKSYYQIHEQHTDVFDVVLVDEGHHVSTLKGQYVEILEASNAKVKGALTATLPYLPQAKMCLEAYIGPVIGEYTIAEGVEDGYLARPEVVMYDVPKKPYWEMKDVSWHKSKDGSVPSKYIRVYMNGIVLNETRNSYICEDLANSYRAGDTILIIVKRILHGHVLVKMIKEKYPDVDVVFASGTTKHRDMLLDALRKGEVRAVIATNIFTEGVDLPDLNLIINAVGELSELSVVQKAGRVLRPGKDGDKEIGRIIDYYDTSDPILERHSKKRLSLYRKHGWIK